MSSTDAPNTQQRRLKSQQRRILPPPTFSLLLLLLAAGLLVAGCQASEQLSQHDDDTTSSNSSSSNSRQNLRRRDSIQSKIVGGNLAREPYPFFVDWDGRCGGSLIAEGRSLYTFVLVSDIYSTVQYSTASTER
jgi:hypothetical protein